MTELAEANGRGIKADVARAGVGRLAPYLEASPSQFIILLAPIQCPVRSGNLLIGLFFANLHEDWLITSQNKPACGQ